MIIEIDKRLLSEIYNGNIKKAVAAGDYKRWTHDSIKNAFNFGNGTEKDLKRYMEDNKKYCVFMEA